MEFDFQLDSFALFSEVLQDRRYWSTSDRLVLFFCLVAIRDCG